MRLFPLFLASSLAAFAQTDWPVYGHDPGGMEQARTFHGGRPGSQVTPPVAIRIDFPDKNTQFAVPSKITRSNTQEI